MSGYVRIHRTLFGHPAFRNESETMAFAWMIGKAAWKSTRVRYKGHSITLDRGQLAISQRDMASAFDRDKAWIERLWKRLKSEAMIETSVEAGVAVITICNYAEYQADGEEREAAVKAPDEAGNEAGVRQRRGTEQRKEEDKKDITRGRAKSLIPEGWAPEQFGEGTKSRTIVDRWTADQLALQVERFTAHHVSRGNRFTDWQAAWKTWVINSAEFAPPAARPAPQGQHVDFLEYKLQQRREAQGVR